MRTLRSMDSPWHRLPWTLPSALLIWTVALWGLAYFMEKPTHRPVDPPPIDARLIELPVLAPPQSIQPKRPAVVHQPKPLPPVRPQKAPVTTQVTPRTEHVTTNPSVPAIAVSSDAHSKSSEGQSTAAVITSPNGGAQLGSFSGKGPSRGSLYGNSGARAIVRPMPQIPDDLREEAFSSAALARFHITVDGSVSVELAKPTPNPRINRILLESLRKWRFMPAIKNGKPVSSTEEIVVKVEVH